MKKVLFSVICLLLFAGPPTAFAQKHADLQLSILSPTEGQLIPYGDTLYFKISIKNLGPDAIDSTDSIFYNIPGAPFGFVIFGDLAPGDSLTYIPYINVNGEPHDLQDTMCVYIAKELDDSIIDTNQTNDSACVSFVYQGDTATGIANIQSPSSQLTIYPNPAQAFTNLLLNLKQPGKVAVKLTDVTGRTVFYKDYGMLQGKEKLKIDVSALPSGMYFIHLSEGAKQVAGKLVVQ